MLSRCGKGAARAPGTTDSVLDGPEHSEANTESKREYDVIALATGNAFPGKPGTVVYQNPHKIKTQMYNCTCGCVKSVSR